MNDPFEQTRPILNTPPAEVSLRFAYSSGDRPLAGYTIKRGIGRGGFGEVYYGISDGGKEVALKLVQRNLDVELRGVAQCLNLKHPNLVSLYDVKRSDNGDYWIVMEHVSGESLAEAIDRHPQGLPPGETLHWIEGICGGVAYLHDRGIVHRDLKPANIFMEEGVVKIGDYGLSKFITTSRRSGQTESVGTVHYMAPEIANGRYGKEIDIYAAGIMLYEMLTGQVPFDGESVGEILMKHLTAQPDVNAVPQRFRGVVGRALAKDPEHRYQDIEAMQREACGTATAPPPYATAAVAAPPTDLGEADLLAGGPAAARPAATPEAGVWAAFLREDPLVRFCRRTWRNLSPNNFWHVVLLVPVALLLLLSLPYWIVPVAAYAIVALFLRWMKPPAASTNAADLQRTVTRRRVPPAPPLAAEAPRAVELVAESPRARPSGRRGAGGFLRFVICIFLGVGIGLLTGGIATGMFRSDETGAMIGVGTGFLVAGIALVRSFSNSQWPGWIVAPFVGVALGLVCGSAAAEMSRSDDAGALVGVGIGLLSGALVLRRWFAPSRGLVWITAPLAGVGLGFLAAVVASGMSSRSDEAGVLIGAGVGFLACALVASRSARPAPAAQHAGPGSAGRAILKAFVVLMLVGSGLGAALVVTYAHSREARHARIVAVERARSQRAAAMARFATGSASADINLVLRTFRFSSDRAEQLTLIAMRPELTPVEQIFLIDVVFNEIHNAEDRVSVLLALASNRSLAQSAREHLVKYLPKVPFTSSRERIAKTLLLNPGTGDDRSRRRPRSTDAEAPEAPSPEAPLSSQSLP